jgi:carbon storage regulator CsrA
MLVLGCTNHQSVIIDDLIKVTVLYNKQGQVVLGIDAPNSVDIRREDVSPWIQENEKLKNINNSFENK